MDEITTLRCIKLYMHDFLDCEEFWENKEIYDEFVVLCSYILRVNGLL